MSADELQLGGQAVAALLQVLIFAGGIAVYLRLVTRLQSGGGQVRTHGLDLPDLLVSFVLLSAFGGLALYAIMSGTAAAAPAKPDQALQNSGFFVVLAAGVLAFLYARGLRPGALFGVFRLGPLRTLGWALLLLIAAFPFVMLVNYVTTNLLEGEIVRQPMVEFFRGAAERGDYAAMASVGVAAILVAPVCEEFFFRGYFYGVGKRYFGAWISGALTAALFAAIHANLASLPGLFVLAVALTLAYEGTGSLLVPMTMHALFNATSLGVLYAQGSGMLPAMKLRGYGEDRLVAELTRALPLGEDVRVGAGDDCAVIGKPRDKRWQLLKADAVVEGVHFLATDKPYRIGNKALCRALSDIAAMGGVPQHALITVAVSPEVEVAPVHALYAGLRDAAQRFGVSIVGGETSRSPGPLFINVTLTGWVERKHCALRSGGKAGDVLYVTGQLGGSRAGKHLDFTPRLAEARWLVAHAPIHAMMDLSDGLAADLPRLATASRCGLRLDETAVPRSANATLQQALTDGEDFELLFAISPRAAKKLERAWRRKFPKLPLTRIGSLTTDLQSPITNHPPPRGFDHFAES